MDPFWTIDSNELEELDKLPENLAIDQIVDHVHYVEKVQKGLSDFLKLATSIQKKKQSIAW